MPVTHTQAATGPILEEPVAPGPLLRVLAWASFVAQTVIIGTGGAVRLTGSGLGCSEWPMCTPESLVPTPEQGIHGLIEFGNRLMTGVVGIIAVVVLLLTLAMLGGRRPVLSAVRYALAGIAAGVVCFGIGALVDLPGAACFSLGVLVVAAIGAVSSLRNTPRRRDLNSLAWVVLLGVIAQAFVGGITVLTGLNPLVVGFHYTASLLLVCVTAAYLVRLGAAPGPRELAVPRWFSALTHVTGVALAATIFFGVLTTGSGPHSGDANVVREGFDASLLAHVHSWPGYALGALLLVLTIAAWKCRMEPRRWLLVLVVAVLVQIGVGVWQARESLPALLVGIHMVLAALSAAAYTVVVLRLKRVVPTQLD